MYEVGTNDFNVEDAYPFYKSDPAVRSEEKFTAPRTGVMPMTFMTCAAVGSYDFTAWVRHVVRLAIPAAKTLPRKGTVNVAVHNADGASISDPGLSVALQMRRVRNGRWTGVGSGPANGDVAAIPYTAPRDLRGLKVRLRAIAAGTSYLTATSRPIRTRIR